MDFFGGGLIERRCGLKVLGGFKKLRLENFFGLGNNLNKFVEVFMDLIFNLIGGGGVGRKTLKFGGICLDSFIGVGVFFFKGVVIVLESVFFFELSVLNIF